MRVGTWNVHRFQATTPDGRVTLEGVRDTLEGLDPHIVGLQETEMARPTGGAYDAPGWLGRELGLHSVYGPPTRDQVYGVSLLSAYPVLDHRLVDLPVDGSVPRVAVAATLKTPAGPLPVYVAHLSVIERPADRAAQARVLVDEVTSHDRAILVGDMNSDPEAGDGEAYRILEGNLTDAWTAGGEGPGPTAFWPGPSLRIDHVWLAGDWTVQDAKVVGQAEHSDHRAVVAEVAPDG
jgi:endonuclease/exonuclease/phosphatase family metal-dependent hydrolase